VAVKVCKCDSDGQDANKVLMEEACLFFDSFSIAVIRIRYRHNVSIPPQTYYSISWDSMCKLYCLDCFGVGFTWRIEVSLSYTLSLLKTFH
jgi:hypothetical protein